MINNNDIPFNNYWKDLDNDLRNMFMNREGLLYSMMKYQMGWIDQQGARIAGYPEYSPLSLLCLTSCNALTQDYRAALPAASALELINHYSLIHSDIREGKTERNHNPTVWWLWGPGQAINAGDGMHALGRLALLRLQQGSTHYDRTLAALQILDEACLAMCEGQEMDLAFQESLTIGMDNYLSMVQKREGALLSAAMTLGAMVTGIDAETLSMLKTCGLNLALAARVRKDIIEIWPQSSETAPSPKILNKKKNLPVVYTLNHGTIHQKRTLGTMYLKRMLDFSDLQSIRELLADTESQRFCIDAANSYYELAIKSLPQTGSTSFNVTELQHIVDLLISSDRW